MRCPREVRIWVLARGSWSALQELSSGKPRQVNLVNKWSERWPGLGFGRSHCSCWPRDGWLDPVDHQERVRGMVCVFCFYSTWCFELMLFPNDHLHPPSTIITIAHRLNTVMDFDRILVLKEGAIAELDTPRFITSSFYIKVIFIVFSSSVTCWKLRGASFRACARTQGLTYHL